MGKEVGRRFFGGCLGRRPRIIDIALMRVLLCLMFVLAMYMFTPVFFSCG